MSHTRSFDLNLEYDTEEDGTNSRQNHVVDLDDDGIESSHQSENIVENHDNELDRVEVLSSEDIQRSEKKLIGPPSVGMMFAHGDQFLEYCHEYGKENGFQIRIRSSDKLIDDASSNGVASSKEKYKRLRLECSKAGKFDSESKDPRKGSSSCITGCKFKVNASRECEGLWKIPRALLEHNHDCVPKNSKFLPNYRFITEGNKKRILDNDRAGVPIAKNYTSFVVQHGNHEDVDFDERDLRNLIAKARRLHMGKGDFAAMMNHFDEMSSSNSNFFYSYDVDENNRLRNVFWADGRSRAAYLEFGDAVSFDTTYVSNRYKMPFAPFIGVNNYGQSVLFGCALLAGEEIHNFVWLFRTWLTCMSKKAPKAIITDQCKSIGNAVAQVFPNTPHRWCIWHVMQNANKHLSSKPAWNNILKSLQEALHDSLSISEFEDAWQKMVELYELQNNKWLTEIYDKRRRWVPVYFKDNFWAGMSSTQRSEGMNHFFKKFVNVNTTLKIFVERYGMALSKRVRAEEKANFGSWNSPVQCMTDHVFEHVFQQLYTSTMFSQFQEEVRNLMYNNATKVLDDGKMCLYDIVVKQPRNGRTHCKLFRVTMDKETLDMKCECKNFEFRGILCTHLLRVFHEEQLDYVPNRYILDRWRKDLPREHLKISVPYYQLLEKKSEGIQRYEAMHGTLDSFAGFAMNDAELYKEVMTTLDGLKTKVKSAAREKHGLHLHVLGGIGKVYGRRVVHHNGNKLNEEGDPVEKDSTRVKDPFDQRGKGATLGRRLGYQKDKARARKRKQKEKPNRESGAQTSTMNHQVNFMSMPMPNPNLLYHSMIPTYSFDRNEMVNPPLYSTQLSQSNPFESTSFQSKLYMHPKT